MIINGRYLAAHPTGVQRVASALVTQLDARVGEAALPDWTLMRPENSREPRLRRIRDFAAGRARGQAWEQLTLSRRARGSVLLNLCNTAPLAHPNNVVMIHDAQVYLTPESYSRAFRNWYSFLLPRLGARARRVLTVSEYSKAQLIRFGVAAPEWIDVVPNGADHLRVVTPDWGAVKRLDLRGRPFVMAMSSVQHHKNIGILLEAMTRPELTGAKLVLVGRDDNRAFAAAGLRVSDSVIFAGAVNDAELSGLLRRACALAVPSLTEGFGLPPLEAMSVGCPVVVAPEGALPEVCGDAALYANARDAGAWALQLAEAIENRVLSAQLVERGWLQSGVYTWDASGERLMQVLASVEAC